MREPKGAVLFRRDEPAFGIFLVLKGSVSLRLECDKGKALLDRTAKRNSIVGLPATLAGGRYSLTAVTLKESKLAFVDRPALIELIKDDPSIGLELMRALGDEVIHMRAMLVSAPAAVYKSRRPTQSLGGLAMPHHEYFCHACKTTFQQPPSPSDYEEGDVVCPHCGSDDVEQRASAFYPVSSKETA